jgi:hypothetical protein
MGCELHAAAVHQRGYLPLAEQSESATFTVLSGLGAGWHRARSSRATPVVGPQARPRVASRAAALVRSRHAPTRAASRTGSTGAGRSSCTTSSPTTAASAATSTSLGVCQNSAAREKQGGEESEMLLHLIRLRYTHLTGNGARRAWVPAKRLSRRGSGPLTRVVVLAARHCLFECLEVAEWLAWLRPAVTGGGLRGQALVGDGRGPIPTMLGPCASFPIGR